MVLIPCDEGFYTIERETIWRWTEQGEHLGRPRFKIKKAVADGEDLWLLSKEGKLHLNGEQHSENIIDFDVLNGKRVSLSWHGSVMTNFGYTQCILRGKYVSLSQEGSILVTHPDYLVELIPPSCYELIRDKKVLRGWFLPDGRKLLKIGRREFMLDGESLYPYDGVSIHPTGWLLWSREGKFYGSYEGACSTEIKSAAYSSGSVCYQANTLRWISC